jgi:hypothetical protein
MAARPDDCEGETSAKCGNLSWTSGSRLRRTPGEDTATEPGTERKVSRCAGLMAFAQQSQQESAWANKSTDTAIWRHAVWPRWSLKQSKRTVAAGRALLATAIATGALTRRATRDDTQQSVERFSAQAADCILFVGGFVC